MESNNLNVLSRRKTISLLGLGTLSLYVPFGFLQGQSQHKNIESERLYFLTMRIN